MGKAGNDWLLKVEDTHGGGTYSTLGGLRSNGITRNAEAIDATNKGSNQNRELLDGAGIKSASVSGSGIYTSSTTLTRVEDAHANQTLTNFQMVDDDSGRTYSFSAKITSFERGGDYNAEMNYTISLEISGAITVS